MTTQVRNDASLGVFFARQLEQVKSREYNVKKAPLRAFELIPISSEISEGAETITYRQFDQVGMAKIIANYADDLPRADVKGREVTQRVRGIGNSYGWNVQELRAAMYAGLDLTGSKRNATRRIMDEKMNRIAWYGDAEYGLVGLFGLENVPDSTAAQNEAGDSTEWANKSNSEILADLNTLANGINTRTNGVEQPDTIVLPIDQYTLIATRNAGMGTDTTLMQFFLNNSPFISRIEWYNEGTAEMLAANGIDRFTGDVAFAYRYDVDALSWEIPMLFLEHEPEKRNLEWIVNCESRNGGVIAYYPLSMAFLDGI